MKNTIGNLIVGAGILVLLTHAARAQWVQTNGPFSGDVNAFAVSGGNLFAGTSVGVFLSTNNGTSWTAIIVGPMVLSLAVSGSNIFAGTNEGVFLSTNNGTSWTEVDSGIT